MEEDVFQFSCHINQGPRENLEDAATARVVANPLETAHVVALAGVLDGVGGHRAGEVASALAKHYLTNHLTSLAAQVCLRGAMAHDAILTALCDALDGANRLILDHANKDPRLKGMATTAVGALLAEGVVYVGVCYS